MTALRLRITEELLAAVGECDRHIPIETLDMGSLLLGVVQDCVLRWSLTGRQYDLVAEDDRLIGLQLRLYGLENGGDRS